MDEPMAADSIPYFHNQLGVAEVRIAAKEFMCTNDLPLFDHSHVFIDMGSDKPSAGHPMPTAVFRIIKPPLRQSLVFGRPFYLSVPGADIAGNPPDHFADSTPLVHARGGAGARKVHSPA
jgi:uncharacterized Zn-finger protein